MCAENTGSRGAEERADAAAGLRVVEPVPAGMFVAERRAGRARAADPGPLRPVLRQPAPRPRQGVSGTIASAIAGADLAGRGG